MVLFKSPQKEPPAMDKYERNIFGKTKSTTMKIEECYLILKFNQNFDKYGDEVLRKLEEGQQNKEKSGSFMKYKFESYCRFFVKFI